jgi:hypothetical protein
MARKPCARAVAQDLLTDLLGVAVRRFRGLHRRVFADRQRVGLAVDGARRAEDQPALRVLGGELEQVDEAAEVVAVVRERLLHRLADRLVGSEVDDAGEVGHAGEERAASDRIGEVDVRPHRLLAGDRGDAVEHGRVGVRQVVGDDDLVAARQQFDRGVRTDEAEAPGDEDRLHACTPTLGSRPACSRNAARGRPAAGQATGAGPTVTSIMASDGRRPERTAQRTRTARSGDRQARADRATRSPAVDGTGRSAAGGAAL